MNLDQNAQDLLGGCLDDFSSEVSSMNAGQTTIELELDRITPDPDQPRRYFDEEVIKEIAESIDTYGLIQPIIVRPDPSSLDRFLIVSGEQRYRAHQLLNRSRITCLVRDDYSDANLPFVQFLENERRSPLKFQEKADFIVKLLKESGSVSELSRRLGMNKNEIYQFTRWEHAPEFMRSASMHFVSMRPFVDLLALIPEHEKEVKALLDSLPADPKHEDYILSRNEIDKFRAAIKARNHSGAPENGPNQSMSNEISGAPDNDSSESAGQGTADPQISEHTAGQGESQEISGAPEDFSPAKTEQEVPAPAATTGQSEGPTPAQTEGPVVFSGAPEENSQPYSEPNIFEQVNPEPPVGQGTAPENSGAPETEPRPASMADFCGAPECYPQLVLSNGVEEFIYLPQYWSKAADQIVVLTADGKVIEVVAAGLTVLRVDYTGGFSGAPETTARRA